MSVDDSAADVNEISKALVGEFIIILARRGLLLSGPKVMEIVDHFYIRMVFAFIKNSNKSFSEKDSEFDLQLASFIRDIHMDNVKNLIDSISSNTPNH